MISLFCSELKLQGRHWVWWLGLLLSFIYGWFLVNHQTPGDDIVRGGAYFLIKTFSMQLLVLPVLVAILSANAVVRDTEQNMAHLIYTAASKLPMLLLTRFFVLVLLGLGLYLSFAVGMASGLLQQPLVNYGLALSSLGWSLSFLLLPNLIFMAMLLTVVGLSTQRSVYLYLCAAFFFVGYQFFLGVSGSPMMATKLAPNPDWIPWFSVLDPFGLSAYFQTVSEWTPKQKNLQIPAFDYAFVTNRLWVLIFALGSVALSIRSHAKRYPAETEKNETTLASTLANRYKQTFVTSFISKIAFCCNRYLISLSAKVIPESTTLTIMASQVRLTFTTKTFAVMNLGLFFVVASEVYFGIAHLENLGASAVASNMIVINRFAGDVLPNFASLFILLLSAELVWRDKSTGLSPLVYATNVSNRSLFWGKLLALSWLPLVFISVSIVAAVLVQSLKNGTVELNAYRGLYIYIGLPLLWLAAMCLVVHCVTPNKYAGLLVSFILFLLLDSSLLKQVGLEHPLWTLGKYPAVQFSEIIHYGGQLDGFWGYQLFRFAILLVLCALAYGHMRKAEGTSARLAGFNCRVLVISTRNTKARVALLGVVVSLLAVTNIVVHTWYEGGYQSSAQTASNKAKYETYFKEFLHSPALKIETVKTTIELYPQERRMRLQGEYLLVNKSEEPISRVLLSTPRTMNFTSVELENAEIAEAKHKLNTFVYEFAQPILPGETSTLSFTAHYQQNGYLPLRSDNFLHANYSYFRFLRYLPWVGYVEQFELKNEQLRQELGLPEKHSRSLEQDLHFYGGDMSSLYQWASLDTTIITDVAHTAIAPGELVSEEEMGARKMTRFITRQAVRNLGHIVSSSLVRQKKVVQGISLEVYFPDGKEAYADKHMQAMQDMLEYGNRHFGSLKHSAIRLVAIPGFFPATGYALPQTVFIGEDVGFHADLHTTNGFDHVYRRTVHEVAHQWWGHSINGAATEGEGVLIETLAKYSEMILLKHRYGHDYVKRLIAYEQRRYHAGRGRSQATELPLYRADANHLIYSKGAAAMYALTQILGEQAINNALASLVTNHSYPDKPATTLDLIRYLSKDKTTEQIHLIESWFYETQVYDLAIEDATYSLVKNSLSEQGYQLNFCVVNTKAETSTEEISTLSSSEVMLEVYDENDVLIKAQNINVAKHTIEGHCEEWVLPAKPDRLQLDPDLLVLDSNHRNNTVRVKALELE